MLRWTLGYTCLFQFWFPQCVCPAVGLLGQKAVLFAIFKGISTLYSIVAVLVCIPTNSLRGFPLLHTLSSIYCLYTFGSQPFTGLKWYLIGLDLHFSDNDKCFLTKNLKLFPFFAYNILHYFHSFPFPHPFFRLTEQYSVLLVFSKKSFGLALLITCIICLVSTFIFKICFYFSGRVKKIFCTVSGNNFAYRKLLD